MAQRTLQLELSDGGVLLPAQSALAAIPQSAPVRHAELGLRPAVATYNVSIDRIGRRLHRVLHAVEGVRCDSESVAAIEELLEAQEALLHAFMQHMEECAKILRGFARDDAAFVKDPRSKAYGKQVRAYRDHIGGLVNRIKHQQGRLRFISARLHRRPDCWWCGYFVEGWLAAGGVGPEPTIHRAGAGAFSLNHDLRYHLSELLFTSEALAVALRGMFPVMDQTNESTAASKALLNQIRVTITLPKTYFPDEYEKPRPVLQITETTHGPRLIATVQSSKSWRPFAGDTVQFNVQFRGDGVTRSWKLPYRPHSS